jgi:NAD(P)-dependent dehydrogenase (short-subunit alcohol dehydrogenase family)
MNGKVALVTGAASGLGRAVALAIAQAGGDVAVVDLNAAGLSATADAVREMGRRAETIAADLSTPEACRSVVEQAVGAFGKLDALCNVAGVIVFCNSHEMAVADWDRTLAINLSAPFHLMQAAIPHLLRANGAIVNVTSQAAFVPQSYSTAYSATKAALTNLTRALAVEYSHKPIRINAVAPGGMMTNMLGTVQMPSDADMSLVQRFSALRGLVEVDDVADMVAYLASPAAKGYHGACINIDAGGSAG